MGEEINFEGYHLEYKDPAANHDKWYTVLIGDDGTCLHAWGRAGTRGQNKLSSCSTRAEAEQLGLKKVWQKQAGGYVEKVAKFQFKVNENFYDDRIGAAERLIREFTVARRTPQYTTTGSALVTHYNEFVDKASALLAQAGSRTFEEVLVDSEELEAVWKDIEERHSAAETTLSLIQATLSQKLMSGSL